MELAVMPDVTDRVQRNRRIRILHFVSTFDPKTDTLWLSRLAHEIDRTRHDWSLACFYGSDALRPVFEECGCVTNNLRVRHEWDLRAISRARRLIRSYRPDVVHTHLLRADLYGGLAARLEHVPVILSTAYAIGAYRRATLRKMDGVLDALWKRIPTHMLAVSEAVRDDLVRNLRWPASRISVVHTGVGLPERSPDSGVRDALRASWGISRNAPVIMTAARLSYEKGLGTLIDAVPRMLAAVPDMQLIIAGDGPLREELQRRIESYNMTNTVRMLGFCDDVNRIMQAADLFVLPSRMEGMPNALLEAMAAGLPVVASRVGGIPEAVEDGVEGLLVSPGNPAELADAVIRIMSSTIVHARMSQAARRRIDDQFRVDLVARRYEALYERLYSERVNASRGGMP